MQHRSVIFKFYLQQHKDLVVQGLFKSEQNIDLGLTIKPTIAHKEEIHMNEASYVQETKLVPNGVRHELLEKYRHKIITTE